MAKISKEGKKDLVSNLKSRFEKSAGSVLANYHGLSVSQLQELKKDLKGADAEFTVTKNTLLDRASKEAGKNIASENLEGPTAILFSYSDPIQPIKILAEFIKKYGLPTIKGGIFENSLLSKEDVVSLSKIPGKNELYSKIVSSLNYPIYGIVSVLSGNLRNLVYVLSEVQKQKGGA